MLGAAVTLLLFHSASALVVGTAPSVGHAAVWMAAEAPAPSTSAPLPAERYIATNRFRVKAGREAAFEKRWADRKSRLGLLDGFRFFCMMRRVELEGRPPPVDDINYISCTVWEDFPSFDAWKKGDAFKEAHGGGTIGGVASMLVASAMNTKGKPKAAMWQGLLPVGAAGSSGGEASAWREVSADGESTLEGEAFIAMNRFSVKPGSEAAFESRFAARDSTLTTYDGFKAFLLLRRDGDDPDGVTHSTWSVWRDRQSFEAWQGSAERAGKPKAAPAQPGAKPPSIYARPPVPTFYEGILVLESAEGV
jgi:heme-degrading monooxygenase HmoA